MMAKPGRLIRKAEAQAEFTTHSHPWNAKSEISGVQLGRLAGLERTGVSLARIEPGKESFAYHSHEREEEWIYILSGTATADVDGAEHPVGPGDFIGFPTPSVAHHLRNTGDEPLVYLMGGENRDSEVATFPTLGKRMVKFSGRVEIYDLADERGMKPLGQGGEEPK
jgi:uncharacterized cupin superfamily protein